MKAPLTAASFAEHTRPHWAAMHRFAARLSGSSERAADLVQEALIRAFKARDRYDGRQPLAPWLLTILRNVFWDQLRAAGRRPEVPLTDDELVCDTSPDALERVLVTERVERLAWHLAALPEEYREVLILVVLEGQSYEETARITGAPVGTVRSRLFRGRALLSKRITEDRELSSAVDRIQG